jgi:radical SAM superfamily enzyme YgiQ (UPF0313 family)
MYKDLDFEVKPLAEIKADIKKARKIYGSIDTIFLGDSDNLAHNDLAAIVTEIREVFPEVRRITTYTRAKTIKRRKADFLKAVHQAGLDRLHLGLESGDAEVLARLNKGATPEDMIQGGQKAKEAGFEVSFYVLIGAGGTERWKEHARNSAQVLNTVRPDYIRLRTLTVQYGTSLDDMLASGEFELTPPLTRLKEVRLFLENLDLEDCFLASDHLTNYLWEGQEIVYRGITGELPQEKTRMLSTLKHILTRVECSPETIKDSNMLYRSGLIPHL